MSEFKKMFVFEWLCLQRTFSNTMAFVDIKNLLIVFAAFIVGAVIGVNVLGWDYIVSHLTISIVFGFCGIVVFTILVFLFNLLLSPSKIVNEKEHEILELNNKINELKAFIKTSSETTKPNVSLVEAVYYIAFGKWNIDSVIDDNREYIDSPTQNSLTIAIDNARHEARAG